MFVNVLEGISDHKILHCEFQILREKSRNTKTTILDYRRADINAISSLLASFFIDFLSFLNDRDANENWTLICDKLISLREKYIPQISIAASTQSTWFTTHVKRCINKKK